MGPVASAGHISAFYSRYGFSAGPHCDPGWSRTFPNLAACFAVERRFDQSQSLAGTWSVVWLALPARTSGNYPNPGIAHLVDLSTTVLRVRI